MHTDSLADKQLLQNNLEAMSFPGTTEPRGGYSPNVLITTRVTSECEVLRTETLRWFLAQNNLLSLVCLWEILNNHSLGGWGIT